MCASDMRLDETFVRISFLLLFLFLAWIGMKAYTVESFIVRMVDSF